MTWSHVGDTKQWGSHGMVESHFAWESGSSDKSGRLKKLGFAGQSERMYTTITEVEEKKKGSKREIYIGHGGWDRTA